MSKKFVWLYAFCLSWGMLLIERAMLGKWNQKISILIILPLCFTIFVVYWKRKFREEQSIRINDVAVCIILLFVSYFIDCICGEKYGLIISLLLFLVVGNMTILMLGSLQRYLPSGGGRKKGLNAIIRILFVFCLVKCGNELLRNEMICLFDGLMIFIIILCYYRCFLYDP